MTERCKEECALASFCDLSPETQVALIARLAQTAVEAAPIEDTVAPAASNNTVERQVELEVALASIAAKGRERNTFDLRDVPGGMMVAIHFERMSGIRRKEAGLPMWGREWGRVSAERRLVLRRLPEEERNQDLEEWAGPSFSVLQDSVRFYSSKRHDVELVGEYKPKKGRALLKSGTKISGLHVDAPTLGSGHDDSVLFQGATVRYYPNSHTNELEPFQLEGRTLGVERVEVAANSNNTAPVQIIPPASALEAAWPWE